MNELNRKYIIICVVSLFFLAYAASCVFAVFNRQKQEAHEYLLSMDSEQIGLIANSEDTGLNPLGEVSHTHTYWVASDNEVGWPALMPYDRSAAKGISGTVTRYYANHGNPKLYEVLRGEQIPIFIHVSTNVLLHEGTINGERFQVIMDSHRAEYNANAFYDADEYADLALYTALNHWLRGNVTEAERWFRIIEAMWNGVGFNDKPVSNDHFFRTYKHGLFLYVAKVTQFSTSILSDVEQRMWSQQNALGGITTHMTLDGEPIGTANAETTAMVLLSYNNDLIETVRNREVYQPPVEQPWYTNPFFVPVIVAIIVLAVIVKWRLASKL